MKLSTKLAVVTVMVLLLLGSATAVLAQRNFPNRTRHLNVWGEVTAVGDKSFTLQARRGNFTILTDDSTRYRVRGNQKDSINTMAVGGRAIVIGIRVEDQKNTILARVIGLRQRGVRQHDRK